MLLTQQHTFHLSPTKSPEEDKNNTTTHTPSERDTRIHNRMGTHCMQCTALHIDRFQWNGWDKYRNRAKKKMKNKKWEWKTDVTKPKWSVHKANVSFNLLFSLVNCIKPRIWWMTTEKKSNKKNTQPKQKKTFQRNKWNLCIYISFGHTNP